MDVIDKNKNRKARKDHACDWCGGVINKEELYDWQKIASDDHGIYEWKAHKHCVEVASYYDMFDDEEEGLSQGSFSDRVFDRYTELEGYEKNIDLPNQVLALFLGIHNAN